MTKPKFEAYRVDGKDDVIATEFPALPGWSVRVHGDGGITITPSLGGRLTQPALRKLPFGAVLDAADELTRDDRIERHARGFKLTKAMRTPGSANDEAVVRAYRLALAQGLSPRALIGRIFGLTDQVAGMRITLLRRQRKLGSVQEERAALSGSTR